MEITYSLVVARRTVFTSRLHLALETLNEEKRGISAGLHHFIKFGLSVCQCKDARKAPCLAPCVVAQVPSVEHVIGTLSLSRCSAVRLYPRNTIPQALKTLIPPNKQASGHADCPSGKCSPMPITLEPPGPPSYRAHGIRDRPGSNT